MIKKDTNIFQRLATAFGGIGKALLHEKNFRLQSVIGLMVVVGSLWFGLDRIENSIIILAIAIVLALELLNSQIEKFLDIIEPNHHHKVKIIKDFSAGAVLISAIVSMVIGLLIFWPHVLG